MSNILTKATVLVLNRNCQAKELNQKKADRLPHEAGLKLWVPRAPKQLPVSALIRNTREVEDWNQFLP